MRLKKVVVTGLFGIFDHNIDFRNGEDVSIVFGPNGYGKTVMLRMVAALIAGRERFFHEVPFSEFRLEFSDNSQRIATRITSNENKIATVKLFDIDANGTRRELKRLTVAQNFLDEIDQFVPGLPRYGEGWRDSNGRILGVGEVLERYPSIVNMLPRNVRTKLRSLEMRNVDVFFIETDRLLASKQSDEQKRHRYTLDLSYENESSDRVLRVVQYSKDLTTRIQVALAAYAKHSQESDRTFPERLVHFLRSQMHALSERQILDEMKDLEGHRQRLINLGFLDTEQGLRDLSEDDVHRAKEALSIYVADVREKLKVFDDLAARVGMLIDILNKMYRYKRISIDRNHGFNINGLNNDGTDISSLSSGEQHQLILLYELLFKVPNNGLVLIDEPEISLHVAWQGRFLEDLLGILKITGAQALIATHAPAIIGTRWDLSVELRGPSVEVK